MNQALLLLSSALLGGVAGALAGKLLDEPEARGETNHGLAPESVAALEKTIGELRGRLNALDERLAETALVAM